jgi:RNA polymerase sigma-70 factor (ECF subfamily)
VTVVDDALTRAFREEWAQVVATVIRVTGDWALAEDCAQDAFAAATRTWPRDGVPDRPGAWLTTAARRSALDRVRRAGTEARRLAEVAAMAGTDDVPAPEPDDPRALGDDRLALIATCCHPALALEVQVALTLRTVCGLTVPEIARAFGASEAAMAKRLVRGRRKITEARIPYRVPPADRLPERLDGVLAVVYLVFTEGYAAGAGSELVRSRLCDEAVRLGRLVAGLVPDDPEVLGLLALVLLQDARRAARVDAAGDLVPLEDQDRARWDVAEIGEATGVLRAARRLVRAGGRTGPYLLQARIAAEHARAVPSAASTDWAAVAQLYAELLRVAPSPFAGLAAAVATGMAEGPDAGLAAVDAVSGDARLAGSHYVPAARADLLRRAGRPEAAAPAYREALRLVTNDAERRYLAHRLAEVHPGVGGTTGHGLDPERHGA